MFSWGTEMQHYEEMSENYDGCIVSKNLAKAAFYIEIRDLSIYEL